MTTVATRLDPQALQRLHDLDPGGASRLVERILDAFEESIARLRPRLIAAASSGDSSAVRHVAHTLKSSSASLGAHELSRMFAEVEAIAHQGRGDGLVPRVDALCEEIDAVLVELRPQRGGSA